MKSPRTFGEYTASPTSLEEAHVNQMIIGHLFYKLTKEGVSDAEIVKIAVHVVKSIKKSGGTSVDFDADDLKSALDTYKSDSNQAAIDVAIKAVWGDMGGYFPDDLGIGGELSPTPSPGTGVPLFPGICIYCPGNG